MTSERAAFAIAALLRASAAGARLPALAPGACDVALAAGIAACDAFHVVLAERLDAPLVTADRRLEETRVADGLVRFFGGLA